MANKHSTIIFHGDFGWKSQNGLKILNLFDGISNRNFVVNSVNFIIDNI